jgi:hypothetical protein
MVCHRDRVWRVSIMFFSALVSVRACKHVVSSLLGANDGNLSLVKLSTDVALDWRSCCGCCNMFELDTGFYSAEVHTM